MNRFQKACDGHEITKIIALYPFVLESPLLRPGHTRRILQTLHAHLRNIESRSSNARLTPLATLLPFVERLVEDTKSRKLPPHPAANVHILGILKEGGRYEEGYRFWSWLADQDDTIVDQAVYGAAIELMAYRGRHSLEELEDIYQDGLKRFPGTFAEYHLSPEAVIPDRSRPITIPGIPIGLLQGILTARILNQEYKRAYSALDTALRLYPTSVPRRFFELFMSERPINEAYAIFVLACRSGIVFKPSHLTHLASRLKHGAAAAESEADRLVVIQALANAMYAHMEAGGYCDSPLIGNFFDAIISVIGRAHAHEPASDEKSAKGSAILETVRNMASTLMQAGWADHASLHMYTLTLADLVGDKQAIAEALVAITKLGPSNLSDIKRRVVLQTVGSLGLEDLIEEWWTLIVQIAELNSEGPSRNDWLALAEACRRANLPSFFHDNHARLAHAIDEETSKACRAILAPGYVPKLRQRPPTHENYYMPLSAMKDGLAEIESITNNIAAVFMSGKPLDLTRTPFAMYIDPSHKLMASESHLRKVYDMMTTDPHQPEPPKDPENPGEVHRSSTGIPLDELRFLNWVSINEILRIADFNARDFQAHVDEALREGTSVHAKLALLNFKGVREDVQEEEREVDEAARLAGLKARVVELRMGESIVPSRA